MCVKIEQQKFKDKGINVDIAVCILFYEKPNQTIECIKSVLSSNVPIYVLNNGSSQSARQELERFCKEYKQIKIFESDDNVGVGPGRNYLVKHTNEEWLLFIDNDIVVNTQDWLQKFANHILQFTDIEVFIPRLFNVQDGYYDIHPPFKVVGDCVIRDRKFVNDFTNKFPGGASFVNRKLFDRLGLYDYKMFVGLEEYELCIRGIRLGEPVKARNIYDIELIHDHRQSARKEDRETVLVRHNVNHIETSLKRIIEKHNLNIEGNWRDYAAESIEKFLNDNKKGKEHQKQYFFYNVKEISKKGKEIAFFFTSLILPRQIENTIKKKFYPIPRISPSSCLLYMTNKCNFEKPKSNMSSIEIQNPINMTIANVKKVLSLYPSLENFRIIDCGETTLCSNILDIVNLLKKNSKFIGLITNSTNLDRLFALNNYPNYILIELNGYDSIDKIAENFSKLKLEFNNIGFSFMLNRLNYKDLQKILMLCNDLKPEFLYLTNHLVYNPIFPKDVQKIITTKDKHIIKYINDICTEWDFVKVKPIYADFNSPKFCCKSYDYIISLDSDGNIGGCLRQEPSNATVGNIFTDKDPFNSSEMIRIRDLIHINRHPHNICHFCFHNWSS